MTDPADSVPIREASEQDIRQDPADVATDDSEIDFDDEQDDDQLPLDESEATEVGALLDDPETLSDDEDD